MKKLLFIIITTLLFVSCDKLPSDSQLDGMWQLIEIETSDTKTDVKDDLVYWSFRLNLVQYTSGDQHVFFSHIQRDGNNIVLFDFCNPSKNETIADNNEWMLPTEEDLEKLARWGIFPIEDNTHKGKLETTFTIEQTGSRLVLKGNEETLVFRKY